MKSQTMPVKSSLSEQSEFAESSSSSEAQSQKSPDGSEDGDSSQSTLISTQLHLDCDIYKLTAHLWK